MIKYFIVGFTLLNINLDNNKIEHITIQRKCTSIIPIQAF